MGRRSGAKIRNHDSGKRRVESKEKDETLHRERRIQSDDRGGLGIVMELHREGEVHVAEDLRLTSISSIDDRDEESTDAAGVCHA
jgi:hypothetical protein